MGVLALTEQALPTSVSSQVQVYYDSTAKRLRMVYPDGRVADPGDADLTNYIRNSGMWFAQWQNPANASNVGSTTLRAGHVAGTGGCDGWGVWNENANTTYQRTDTSTTPETGLQGRFYGSFVKITSTGKFFVSQMIEAHDAQAIRGRTVRFTCWMKGTASQTVRLGLVQLNTSGTVDTLPATFISAAGANGTDPTLGTNLAYIAPKSGQTGDNCTANGNAYDCSVTTSWQRFSGVFDAPSNCKNLLPCLWTNAQLTATNGFSIAQLSLTDGYEIQDFTPLPYQSELDRVLRYFSKSFNVDTNPATNAGAGTGEPRWMGVVGNATAVSGLTLPFPVPMRAAPNTITGYNPAASNALVRNVTGAADSSSNSLTANGEKNFLVAYTSSATSTAGQSYGLHWTAEAIGSNKEFA